jgi:hypothetical protein
VKSRDRWNVLPVQDVSRPAASIATGNARHFSGSGTRITQVMSQARVARIAGISLASLWLATALLAAAAVELGEVAAVPAPVVTTADSGAS